MAQAIRILTCLPVLVDLSEGSSQNMETTTIAEHLERRIKARFPLHREMRYKVLHNGGATLLAGNGRTLDISSSGIAFEIDCEVTADTYIELSISWLVLLDDACPMQLIVFGRMLRSGPGRSVCSVDKYEFRTKGRIAPVAAVGRSDLKLKQWVG